MTLSPYDVQVNNGVIFLTCVGLTVDAEVKRGKTIHVPDSVYKKGCIWDVKHGITVSKPKIQGFKKRV